MVPILNINAQNLPLEPELKGAFERVLRSGQFILGPEVAALEADLAAFIGVEHAIAVSSGTDAILLALMALEIGPGDEVLCPAFTFFATAGCVARMGAVPIFVDVDPVTFNIDVADARRKVSGRTKAIIPVHLFGQCARMDEVRALAQDHHLTVIEDAAQSLGAANRGLQAGTFGDFGAFSFYPTKNLGGLGDGGLLVCRDPDLARKARALRNHGAEKTYYHEYVGGNFRLDALQAAFLRVKLPHYGSYTKWRQNHARRYTERLSALPRVKIGATATAEASLILPAAPTDGGHIWNQYTIRVPKRRDELRDALNQRGIHTGIYYPVSLNQQTCFKPFHQEASCPLSAQLADEVLSLPIFSELTATQQDEVIEGIAAFLRA